jgi:hypothetical protein
MWSILSVHLSPNDAAALVAEMKFVSRRNLVVFHFARSSLLIGAWELIMNSRAYTYISDR